MKYFATLYQYDPNNPLIAENRPAHREFIGGLKEKGQILGSGPFPDATGGALIVVQLDADSATCDDAAAIMDGDPFYTSGAVDAREIREWNPVINNWS